MTKNIFVHNVFTYLLLYPCDTFIQVKQIFLNYTSGIPRSKALLFYCFSPQITKLKLAGNKGSELNELKLLSSGADFLQEK